jgi:hypothetical protein
MLNEVTQTPSTPKATVGGLPFVRVPIGTTVNPLHESYSYQAVEREGGRCFVEFLEIGGDPALKPARSVFYSSFTGYLHFSGR